MNHILSVTLAMAVIAGIQNPSLRIVVIEGEGAVNIIQQKTAVAPVVEVRDRNDQPVAGAVVNFAVRTGRATFGGARTLTVTTNAAGRAAAAGFAPSGTGAVQIGATATFQGQTAAAVTIAQTNVLTAAEAAAVSSASGAGGSGSGSAAGGGAGAGGGLPVTTLGIVGGAVAVGAVVAKETLLTGGTEFTGQFNGVMPNVNSPAPGFGTFSCTQNDRQTGTIKIALDKTEGSLSGDMSIDGDLVVTPGNCPPNQYNNNVNDSFVLERGTISGTPENLTATGHDENDYRNTDGSGVNAYDYTFNGRLDGEQIAGTLTIVRNITFRGNDGFMGMSRGTVTYQVVLRKS